MTTTSSTNTSSLSEKTTGSETTTGTTSEMDTEVIAKATTKVTPDQNIIIDTLAYNDQGLIPCIVQDADTHEILMMAWMNKESVRRTLEERTTWFWSRSRNKFWHKGEESGNTQELVALAYDCDEDCLLAQVHPKGPACHTGERTCFYRSLL